MSTSQSQEMSTDLTRCHTLKRHGNMIALITTSEIHVNCVDKISAALRHLVH